MNALRELLSDLYRNAIHLMANGDRLRISAPKGVLTHELRDRMAALKPDLITLFSDPVAWRTEMMRLQVRPSAAFIPVLQARPGPWMRPLCDSCGEDLPQPYRLARCEPCIAASNQVIEETFRNAGAPP